MSSLCYIFVCLVSASCPLWSLSQCVSNPLCFFFGLCSFWLQRSYCDKHLGTEEMHPSVNGPRSPHGRDRTGHIPNTSRENSGNSGSQYALCALGVGLVALGIVMIVWSVVPPDMSPDSGSGNTSPSPDWDTGSRKNKASSVAFVLVGSGVAMLLLSLCLGMRNKQREQQMLQDAQNHRAVAVTGQEDREMWVKLK